ncbi:Alpha,alpha-trehalose-phosphate synthase (UDP-forming) [Penicillium ucsense]|uniref:Alpha,alpha-trehalose-phosphate synthase (UDP-forming) n=1 Tax=Penicillium ucsense TaxID=2839758 RepID=A0A8J8WH71_9EURO|nr:Alpha,alpha-trehalose-phosphate synthase (UDP-forming) [Penicillium ucsense]KAF7733558.1 Alpha,alpha-trehalose-phosphate synthase (UDP-forming) [Penicillium ucsense]
MTVFIASLFLPYTIDFKPAGSRGCRQRSSVVEGAVDGSNSGPIVGRLPRERSGSIALTPGATTVDEKVFKAYASSLADEISITDDPKGPYPSEPRAVLWGHSHKFTQPRSKATDHPEPSLLHHRQPSKDRDYGSLGGMEKMSIPGTPEPESFRHGFSAVDWAVKAAEQGHGGLQNAVHAAEEAGILQDKTWVGTLGMPTDSLPDVIRNVINETLRDDFDSLSVFVSDNAFEGHYAHFCRSVLWPAFHYQMQESPRHNEYDDYSWKQYLKVNEAFADAIADQWKPGDCIWIHDYHLLCLPGLLRSRLPDAEIGFFLHTPFPSSEIFRCLSSREALLDGLLGADLIGFQTDEYCSHFLHTCSRIRRLDALADGIQVHDRFVRVKSWPLGIDYKSLNLLRQSVEVRDWITNITYRYKGKRLIVARDRLDAPGGIKQRLQAYELFLKSYPKWRENVVLVQVASSASEVPELEAQVSKLAMHINAVYSTLTHQPLVFLQQDISYSQFLALLSVADIFMATNLREGMNLTSHDFVHCQDGRLVSQRHGSLVLSEFIGSASIFHGHELLVNPWDYKQCAKTLNKALEMSPQDKERNWRYLIDCKRPYTALSWYSNLQSALRESHMMREYRQTTNLPPLKTKALSTSYNSAHSRLIFLEDSSLSLLDNQASTQAVNDVLRRLVADPRNMIYLTSDLSPDQLAPNESCRPSEMGIIARNGLYARLGNDTVWINLSDNDRIRGWHASVKKVMEYFRERTEGSTIEEDDYSVVFHYENATDQEAAARQASELADLVYGVRGSESIRIVRSQGAVSVKIIEGMAAAASFVWEQISPEQLPELILVAGGKKNYEELFRWANRLPLLSPSSSQPPHITVVPLATGKLTDGARAVLPVGESLIDVLQALAPLDT